MKLPRLRWCLPALSALLISQAARAQTTTESTGAITITVANASYLNLSMFDCEQPAATQSLPIGFTWVYPFATGQTYNYFLSLDQNCVPPTNSTITTGTTTSTSNSSALVEAAQTRMEPADGMTTGADANTTLTFQGIWAYYAQAMNQINGTTQVMYQPAPSPAVCPNNITTATLYFCVYMETPSSTTTGTNTIVSGALAFTLDSTPPPAPATPTAKGLDSAVSVSWTANTGTPTTVYYTVHVQDPLTNMDVSSTTTTGTTAIVEKLVDGVTYNVFLNALDGSGTSPPKTSNVSANSGVVQATPVQSLAYFTQYKLDGGKENGGCRSAGGSTLLLLLIPILLVWRRRRLAAAVLAAALLGPSSARAQDQLQDQLNTKPEESAPLGAPVVRQGSAEWFRVDVMTGPFYPNPDNEAGLHGKPYAQVFTTKNPLLWRAQFHVNFLSLLGHLSIGVSIGLWQTTGHALQLDHVTPASDVEALTLYPLSLLLGYRMDFIYTRHNVPIVPYVKVGYGALYFADTKNGKVTSGVWNGQGWHSWGYAGGPEFAGGIEFPLDFLDPRRAANLDEDLGINSTGIFGEYGYNMWRGFNGGLNLSGSEFSGGIYVAF
jgi:hypothetical protein